MPQYEGYITHTVRVRGSMLIQANSAAYAHRKGDEFAAAGLLGHVICQVEDCRAEFHQSEEEDSSSLIDGPCEVSL